IRLDTRRALPLAHSAFLCTRVSSDVSTGSEIMNINFIYDASVSSAPAGLITALKLSYPFGLPCAWLRRVRRHNQEFCETLKHREADSDRTRKASDDVGADRVRLLNKITFVAVPECNSHVRHH